MTITKSFKIRLYPNKEQETLMWKHIGCCRFMWNYMLDYQEKAYKNGEKHLSAFSMINLITGLKKQEEYTWLNEVSTSSLQTVCRDLEKAYQTFFKKKSRFPKFKSRKRSKLNYPICSNRFHFQKDFVQIQKLGKVKYKTDFNIPYGNDVKFLNPRISYINGKWILSFGMECENQAPVLTDKPMGIDLGVKDLAIVAYGDEQFVYHNINKSARMKRLNKELKHMQRSVSRKYEHSKKQTGKYEKTNNIIKLENEMRKVHARISNIRSNYIHQTTHELISKLPCKVVMEDLNVSGMMKNRHLSKAIQEQCFSEFIRQMKYKCDWNGIEFIQADRFYPSSKTCSNCGCIKSDLKLSDRTYICPECGFTIDRDYNAAINLMRYAV